MLLNIYTNSLSSVSLCRYLVNVTKSNTVVFGWKHENKWIAPYYYIDGIYHDLYETTSNLVRLTSTVSPPKITRKMSYTTPDTTPDVSKLTRKLSYTTPENSPDVSKMTRKLSFTNISNIVSPTSSSIAKRRNSLNEIIANNNVDEEKKPFIVSFDTPQTEYCIITSNEIINDMSIIQSFIKDLHLKYIKLLNAKFNSIIYNILNTETIKLMNKFNIDKQISLSVLNVVKLIEYNVKNSKKYIEITIQNLYAKYIPNSKNIDTSLIMISENIQHFVRILFNNLPNISNISYRVNGPIDVDKIGEEYHLDMQVECSVDINQDTSVIHLLKYLAHLLHMKFQIMDKTLNYTFLCYKDFNVEYHKLLINKKVMILYNDDNIEDKSIRKNYNHDVISMIKKFTNMYIVCNSLEEYFTIHHDYNVEIALIGSGQFDMDMFNTKFKTSYKLEHFV